MKTSRLLVALLVLVLLVGAAVSAFAEGNGYGRTNNPGQGHDWVLDENDDTNNNNENRDLPYNEHGYKNHLGFGEIPV